MCEIIAIGEDTTVIICGGKKNHECNEDARVYEDSNGKRYYFKNDDEAIEWYKKTNLNICMGSVACSICGSAAFDNAYKLEI